MKTHIADTVDKGETAKYVLTCRPTTERRTDSVVIPSGVTVNSPTVLTLHRFNGLAAR
jgi:hypothetical protein